MINNDRKIRISSAGSRKSLSWPVQELWWSEFIEKLKIPARGQEPLAEYLRLPKTKQDELKDVGGFVGGTVNGQRKAANVSGRDLITLDMDNIPAGGTDDFLKGVEALGCGYAVYSTRKHEPSAPRLRVIIPLSRTVTADEYEPIARKMAAIIGIGYCDPTTFQAGRLMYWPSCSSDSIYVCNFGDKPMLSADGVLAMYGDWRDISQWPQVPGIQPIQKLAQKQGDPLEKKGIVGAFCRTYSMHDAMEKFIPGAYEPTDMEGRYTFSRGSTTGGAVLYDDGKFLYSHHATDPAGGKLCNAFDLVRLHKFGELDEETGLNTPVNKLPSYTAMSRFAMEDETVSKLFGQEKYEKAMEDFTGGSEPGASLDWIKQLKLTGNGEFAKTTDNILLIINNDPNLRGKVAFDEFANRGLTLGQLPWDSSEGRRQWSDVDDAGLRHYVEKVYGITGKEKIMDALSLAAHKRTINDVKEYLGGLIWDGFPRLDTLLTDYLGAEDTAYTRAVIRKSLTAAVARAMEPGAKYDFMPIFAGPQGIGKSTFLRILGKAWYSDSLNTFEGKEAAELIQGIWINEVGELNGLSRSETNSVKQFLSKTEDIYREAYGRRTGRFPRRCVFFGTTNDSEFLRDRTGNRRFWPVDVGIAKPGKNVFEDLEAELDQVWAEAVIAWKNGEPLYLTGEAEEMAKTQQEDHSESNAKEGIVKDYLERLLPENWQQLNLGARRMYLADEFKGSEGTEKRKWVCAAEVWCECFGSDIKFMKKSDAKEINDILAGLPGWNRTRTPRKFQLYGNQRGFEKETTF